MARVKIELPEKFIFSTKIPVRITDLNYGGHVGNDTFLSIIHEARLQFFKYYGFTEMDVAGVATIMSDVVLLYKGQLFYGATVTVEVSVTELAKKRFELTYLLMNTETKKEVARARTGMVFFDYDSNKVASMPDTFREIFRLADS